MQAQRELQVKLYPFFNFSARWEWKVNATPPLIPGMIRYPLHGGLDGSKSRSGLVRNISPPPGFDRRSVQSVASRYIDWTSPLRIQSIGTAHFINPRVARTPLRYKMKRPPQARFDTSHTPHQNKLSVTVQMLVTETLAQLRSKCRFYNLRGRKTRDFSETKYISYFPISPGMCNFVTLCWLHSTLT